jgi:hypothetical protein
MWTAANLLDIAALDVYSGDASIRISAGTPDLLVEVSRGISQSLKSNARIAYLLGTTSSF